MAPDLNRTIRRITFGMLALSGAAVEIAAADTRSVWINLGLASIWIAIAAERLHSKKCFDGNGL